MLLLILKLIIAGILLGSSFSTKGRSFLFRYRKSIFRISVLLIFILLIYLSFEHYKLWNSEEFTKLLNSDESFTAELDDLGIKFISIYLEPIFYGINSFIKALIPSYDGGTYLLFYLLTRLWGEYIISFIFAELFLWAMLILNKKYDSRFFYDEEPYFGAVAIFLAGWPGWLYYLIILLSIFLVFNLFATIIINKRDKAYIIENKLENNTNNTLESSANSDKSESSNRFTTYYFWLPIVIAIILLMYFVEKDLPFYNLLKI